MDADGKVKKSEEAYNQKLAGVVSTNPNITIGPQTATSIRLALSGKIPVIVTNINGDIKIGDSITSSMLSGIGMKPDVSAPVIGKAIQTFTGNQTSCSEIDSLSDISFPEDDGKNINAPCFKMKVSALSESTQETITRSYGLTNSDYLYIGKILALSSLSWSDSSDLLASLDSVNLSYDKAVNVIDGDLSYQIDRLNQSDPVVKIANKETKNIKAYSSLVAGKIRAGALIASEIATQNLFAARAQIDSLTSKTILATSSISSPTVKTNKIETDIISPLSNNGVTFELSDSSNSAVVVKNRDKNQEVAKIDSNGDISTQGNISSHDASVSGQLTANNLASNTLTSTDATVSGTLHAGHLIADNIDGLSDKVATLAGQILKSKPSTNSLLTALDGLTPLASVSAQFGTFYEGLLSLGASTFGNISVIDQLSIGTTFTFSQNSINTLGTTLEIQPLRQGAVSFLAGLIFIDSDGKLTVSEDAEFKKNLAVKGKLYANIISPLADGDVQVELPSTPSHDSSFVIKDSSSSAVLSVNNRGDISASGSGRFAQDIEAKQGIFSKLNFNIVGQAIASGDFTATASGSAGTAVLKANTAELTVIDPLVTRDSLIYITPANNTNNKVLYLMRQTPNTSDGPIGSFTVGVSQVLPSDTLFNWLIVN